MAGDTIATKLNWTPKNRQEKLAFSLIKFLHAAGFVKTFIVGGYVRDLLLRRPTDPMLDIATEARPEQVQKLFSKKGFRVIPTGLKHGTVTVRKNGQQAEITTFRTEGKYEDFRRPKTVKYVNSPKLDAGRRDFTINALYFDPISGELWDYFGGLKDLKAKRLRFIGSAKARITEDALRLMRAVRFAVVLGFTLSPKDRQAIRRSAKLIKNISGERVKQELDKMMLSSRRTFGLKLMHLTGLLEQVLPEIENLAKTPQSKNYHSEGNVFVHTLLALDKLEAGTDLPTIYAMLLHDVGKGHTAVKTRKRGRQHISFHGHQEQGEALAKQILSRLRFSRKDVEDISWYVRHHHAPVDIPKMRVVKQRRWLLEPRFCNLLKIFRADSAASIPTNSRGKTLPADMRLYQQALKLYQKVSRQPVLRKRLVGGREVMKILKIKEGPKVGQILERVREKQLEGKIKSKKDALNFLKKFQQKTS